MSRIKTTEELSKLHGRKVNGIICGEYVADAKISIDNDGDIYFCQNFHNGDVAKDMMGYKYSWSISDPNGNYEKDNRCCIEIQLIEESEEYPSTDDIKKYSPSYEVITPKVIQNADKEWQKFLDTIEDVRKIGMKMSSTKLRAYIKKIKGIK